MKRACHKHMSLVLYLRVIHLHLSKCMCQCDVVAYRGVCQRFNSSQFVLWSRSCIAHNTLMKLMSCFCLLIYSRLEVSLYGYHSVILLHVGCNLTFVSITRAIYICQADCECMHLGPTVCYELNNFSFDKVKTATKSSVRVN